MGDQGFLNDPAIIGVSSPSTNHAKNGTSSANRGLKPGSALSKLLDSAMANAAKEVTPETEQRIEAVSEPESNRSSFQNFIPQGKSDLSKVYSISSLLKLRSSPAVIEFDNSRLPDASFWRAKPKDGTTNVKSNSHNSNSSSGHISSGTGKRSRRNAQLANAASQDSLNWERRPAGFLKQPDLDHMSKEKISQLLGEAPEEETPDWDVPGTASDTRIDMGNTVEDFERWKSHMRQEERRKHGEPEPFPATQDVAPANEVDSFFSFVNSKDIAPESAVYALNKHTDSKNSRFSSFFGGSASTPEEPRSVSHDSDASKSAHSSIKGESSAGSSRFFKGESNALHHSSTQNLEIRKSPSERHSHGPPPGMQSNFQTFNAGPHMQPVQGLPHQSNAPPGFHIHPGHPQAPSMPIGATPRGPPTNDSFFFSLLNKNEGTLDADGASSLPAFSRQTVSSGERIGNQEQQHRDGPHPGLNPRNAPSNHSQQFLSYQDTSRGMRPHPGAQIAPGMFPPGMLPPGAQGIPNHGPNYSHQGQRSLPVQHHPQQQKVPGTPNAQMLGDIPPPWMRFGPHGPTGSMPPGFNQLPPGFPPGFARGPPGNQQQPSPQPQSQSGQQK